MLAKDDFSTFKVGITGWKTPCWQRSAPVWNTNETLISLSHSSFFIRMYLNVISRERSERIFCPPLLNRGSQRTHEMGLGPQQLPLWCPSRSHSKAYPSLRDLMLCVLKEICKQNFIQMNRVKVSFSSLY